MSSSRKIFAYCFWVLVIALFLGTLYMSFYYAPVEKSMGMVQKIFYLHLPVAINTFVAAFVVFVASIGYLWQRSLWWDDLAAAAGKITVLFCAVVLLTGIIWGKSAWGAWWSWTPRLTFSLALFLLYIVYLMIRPMIESPQRRAIVSAVYGIAAFLDVPLVYLSAKLMPDIHPASIKLEPAMAHTLLAWFLPVTLLLIGLITVRYKINRKIRTIEQRNRAEAPATNLAGRVGEVT